MTGKTTSSPDEPKAGHDLARFLQHWGDLWQEELRAQANDPDSSPLAMLSGLATARPPVETAALLETWRAALIGWSELVTAPASLMSQFRDRPDASRSAATAAASFAVDAAVERLARRVDELAARLAKLEQTRGAGG